MILIDTSVWIDYIRAGSDDRLDYLLDGESVVMHDFVFGEIAMGSPKNHKPILAMLGDIHRVPTASHFEVMTFVESFKLYGLGLTYIDVHLLAAAHASADLEPIRLWTRDSGLLRQAGRFGVAYNPR
jgi:predicted nucleic acid-binding protein